MALDETRIVLFEKIGFRRNFHIILHDIESVIRFRKSRKENNKRILVRFFPKDKLIQEIFEQNGYIITRHDYGQPTIISWD